MSVRIEKVINKDGLKTFVEFGMQLYEGCPYYVPPLKYDEVATLNPAKNPAFDHCDAACFLAYRRETIVGRIAAIINHKANEIWIQKHARFGFVDFVDDVEVSNALFGKAEEWAKERGMTHIQGPMGFCDFDHEGMLVEGFDKMSTLITIYNYPYYLAHLSRLGYVKDVDWVEYLIKIPQSIPERYERTKAIIEKRFGIECYRPSNKDEAMEYAHDIFRLLNKSYKSLYGFVELTEKQIDYYVDMYIPLLRLEFLSLVVRKEDRKLIGVAIGLPNLSKAMQKAKGTFLPTGWFHLYKALKFKNDVLDLMLVGVDPEYQGKGVNALMFSQFIEGANRLGMRYAESNPELETNNKVQSLWGDFESQQTKRRRVYIKSL